MQCPNCHQYVSSHARRCTSCGKAVPPAQHLLEESGVVDPSSPAATLTSGGVQMRATHRAASLGDRLVAAALDSCVLLGIFAMVSVWAFLRWGVATGADFHLTTASLLIAAVLNGASLFAYLWLMEAGFGATLGKAMVGLRVVQTGPRRPLAAAAIRNALRAVDGLAFYLVGVMIASCSRLRQRLGDIVAGTVVVEEKFPAGIKVLAVVVWTAALAATAWGLPRVCAGKVATQPPRYLGRSVVQLGYTGSSAYLRVSRLRVDLQLTAPAPGAVAHRM